MDKRRVEMIDDEITELRQAIFYCESDIKALKEELESKEWTLNNIFYPKMEKLTKSNGG